MAQGRSRARGRFCVAGMVRTRGSTWGRAVWWWLSVVSSGCQESLGPVLFAALEIVGLEWQAFMLDVAMWL